MHSLTPWLVPSTASILLVACFGFTWQKLCKRPPVWVKQLRSLGQPRKHLIPGTAVICGGSVAGIIAARVCADHFEQVIVVDPDINDPEKERTRIIQRNALHVYLCLFVAGARRLWPNFDIEVADAGGRLAACDLQIHYSGIELLTPFKDYPAGKFPDTLSMKRSTVQKVLHKLLFQTRSTRGIAALAGTVRGIHPSSDTTSIDSVSVRKNDGTQISLNDVALVVDCTGRTQGGFKWLKTAGYSIPDEIRCSYNPGLRYLTWSFSVSPELVAALPIPDQQRKTTLVYVYVPHDETGSCVFGLSINENNTILLMFIVFGLEDFPGSSAEIIPFIKRFRGHNAPVPSWVLQAIEMLVEQSRDISFDSLKLDTLQYIRYQRLQAGTLPSNFVALGDSCLFLNPVHGQGFAKAMMNGITLNALLHNIVPDSRSNLPADFSVRYFRESAGPMQALWDSTRLHDYGTVTCEPMEGETNSTGSLARCFEAKLVSAATEDEEVGSALWHVRQMFAADTSIFAPTVLWKILRTRSLFK